MIEKFSIGIDIVNVKRFSSKRFSENEKFYRKIFTDNEIKYCMNFKEPYTHFAGKFALKEAVIKAIHKKIGLLDIETFHDKNTPRVKLKGIKDFNSLSSISHENEVAVAIFLFES